MDTIRKYTTKYSKYAPWIALLCTQILVSHITKASPIMTVIAILGAISAIASAEGWYITNPIFILYAAGAAWIAFQDNLFGDVAAMVISGFGSVVALFTWRKNLHKYTIKTQKMTHKQWWVIAGGAISIGLIAYLELWLLHAELPFLNAMLFTAVMLAEILFAHRYCETYILEFIGDITLILIWVLSGNWLLALTCLLDTAFAIYGLYNWRELAAGKDKT